MSNSRKQIEAWLKTIDVSGSVIDVGGLFMPVKGRTKSWEVSDYKIADISGGRKGIKTDYICDFNRIGIYDRFDVAFCIEVLDHFWNPVEAFRNINQALYRGGLLYISSNFLFPHHTGFDCLRLTKTGLSKILEETGFKVLEISPRYAVDDTLKIAMSKESKVDYAKGEIGYFVKAIKC